jgi:hypothetical protein
MMRKMLLGIKQRAETAANAGIRPLPAQYRSSPQAVAG